MAQLLGIDVTITLELILVLIEILILTIILYHLREMKENDKLLKENIVELHVLHKDLHKSLKKMCNDLKL